MFLDPKKYLLTIKEKDVHVKGKDIRKDLFQIILLNFKLLTSPKDRIQRRHPQSLLLFPLLIVFQNFYQ